MKRIILLFIIPLFLYCNETTPRHVLLLNSYNQSMSWVQNITKSVYDVLKPSQNNLVIHIENMDTKRIYNKEYLNQLKQIYKNKYQDVTFDLILSSDNNAFDFLKNNRDELFGNVPVSFSGVNFFKDSDLIGHTNYTGITEEFDALGTVATALRLRPNTEEIFVINDYLKTGIAWQNTIKEQLKNVDKEIKITYAKNTTINELKQQLDSLSQNSIVLLGVYFKDKEGTYFTYEKIGEILSTHSKVPVFCLLEFNMKKGVVGGNVIGGYYQGEAMSKIAQKILEGTPVSQLPVQKTGATKSVFDYEQLIKYDMDISHLPSNSLILNKPISYYENHKNIIITSITIISLLVIIIIILLINIKQKKISAIRLKESKNELNKEKKMVEESRRHLKEIIDAVPHMIFIKNSEGRFLQINKATCAIYNKNCDELIGMNQKEILVNMDVNKYLEADKEVIKTNKPNFVAIDKFINPDGDTIFLQIHKFPFYYKGEKSVLGVAVDITNLQNAQNKINDLNKNLERTVSKRTFELSETNIKLEKSIRNLKETQEQLVEAEKIASLGVLVAGVAHEINTPVGTSLTALSYLNECTHKIHDLYNKNNMTEEAFEEYLNDAKQISTTTLKNIKKASSLINSFKQLSIDQTNEEKRIFNIHDYTQEILVSLYNKLNSRKVTINTNINEELKINSYPGSYGQVLSILILNSLMHAFKEDEKGIINIDIRVYEHSLIIEYKDNGTGIKEENLPHIFEPFYTTNRASGGTGLGLNILHNIVTSHLGGKIECYSQFNKGVEFKITLPLT